METIYKYDLQVTDHQVIQLPKGAKILTVQEQLQIPCIWALVDPIAQKEDVEVWTFGTGHEMTDSLSGKIKYLGTYQLNGGRLVFHVFTHPLHH